MIETVCNSTKGDMEEAHILEIPPCCPVSKNPRPGSRIIIRYSPAGKSLEIGSLKVYIHSFRGGLYDATGQLVIRDMEGMIARIAEDCASTLGVKVVVLAELNLVPKQEMILQVEREG
jgi:NADPH-dependent 7-cyano-7-deazaguanine reductase QueF